MEIGSNNIYNSAAVAEATGARTNGSSRGYAGSYTPNKGDDSVRGDGGSVAVESENRTISNLSRARAAVGNPVMSAETQEAIKNGALPPSVAEIKVKPTGSEEISDIEMQLASAGGV